MGLDRSRLLFCSPTQMMWFRETRRCGITGALILLELGVFFYDGKKRNGRLSLKGVLSYRSPILV